MEYVITAQQPFEEIETRTRRALEKRGFVAQRTFSLHSALRVGASPQAATNPQGGTGGNPGYSVLLLYASGARRQPLGLVMLYERAGRTVIQPVLTSPGAEDLEAELAAALTQGGLAFCVAGAEGECLEPEGERWVQDPVCGKWLVAEQAQALVEHEGRAYALCCPLCRDAFAVDPGRYARANRRR